MENAASVLLRQITELNLQLDQCLQKLDHLSSEQLHRKPSTESWSIAQVLSHVKLAELLSIKYVEKKLSFDPVLPKAGFMARLRYKALELFMDLPVKIKAARGVRTENLPTKIDWKAFKSDWERQRKNLSQSIVTLDPKWYDHEVYKHPIVGRISISQMLKFFQLHFDRHVGQIDRILRQVTNQ